MVNRFTPKARDVLEATKLQSEALGHTYIGTEHLLLGLLSTECVGEQILRDKGASLGKILDYVVDFSPSGDSSSLEASFTPRCKRVLEGALAFAKRTGGKFVGTEHLLYAICSDNECVGGRILSYFGISAQGIKNEICALSEALSRMNSRTDSSLSSGLSSYGKCLTSPSAIKRADPLVGREKDIKRLIQILCRKTKNNPCLIGEPGVGKTAIVEGLSKMIAEGNVPSELRDKEIVALDMSSMIAGTKYRGEFEERMRAVLNEVRDLDNIILFIDEIHTIIGAGGAEGAIDAANIIKPSLSRGDLRVIGATTTDEYRKYIEKDSALERRFQPVLIEEPSEDEAITILKGLREKYEVHHGVKISDEAISSAVKLSTRYINDRFLPDKALDLLDEACSAIRTSKTDSSDALLSLKKELEICKDKKEDAIIYGDYERASALRDEEAELLVKIAKEKELIKSSDDGSEPIISEKEIRDIVCLQTKIPINDINGEDTEALRELQERLESAIVGQQSAIESVSWAIKRGRLGIKASNRPCASLFFLGPTGVGKTELAKQVAKCVFGSCEALIRFDMSEYSEKHSISKLIGAPAGYVGYEDEGRLSKAIRRSPYSVVLFDEIEKAHPDIYSLFLQILDEGEIKDSQGKRISFKSAIIIFTSNIGAWGASGVNIGFDMKEKGAFVKGEQMLSELKRSFSPELLNRIDEIIVFKSLSLEEARKICALMLDDLSKRLKNNGILIKFDESIVDFVLNEGYSEEYGARNLRRAITLKIENSICEGILNGKIEKEKQICAKLNENGVFYEYMNM